MKQLLERLVESANASETCCQRNFGHGHPCFMDKLLGEKNSSRLRHRHGRSAQVLKE